MDVVTINTTSKVASTVLPVIPSMLRDELFHPAVIHFPIAFLATSGLVAVIWLISKRGLSVLLTFVALGVVGGWLGILTGGWAEDVVNRVICDPTVTHQHEDWAEWAVWSASAVLPLLLVAKLRSKKSASLGFRVIVTFALLFVSGSVLYAGHLGASLVYQQAAAVYRPSLQCTEFGE